MTAAPQSSSSGSASDPVAFIEARLTDLAEANTLYGKDQRLGAPDKIARNDREISWLKDLRSLIVMRGAAQAAPEGFILIPKAALDWLDGSAPAPDGRWFGQDAPDPDERPYRKYWWRSRFRELCALSSSTDRAIEVNPFANEPPVTSSLRDGAAK